jgi:glycosyltransferase involved in cell wall biosynthesis
LKILFILHFPPPIHGASVVGGYIKQSALLNRTFDCRYINLGLSDSVEEIGDNSFGKVSRYLGLIWKVKKQLIFSRPDLCYLSINAQGPGFYKDALIVLLVRLFGIKPVYHFHNKGITANKINFFENILYRLVFRNADVILISERLYYDFRKYVPETRVHYCTNGIPDCSGLRAQSLRHPSQGKDKICQLLFLSHLFESKGIFILLEACKILQNRKLNFHCTVVGGEGDVTVQQFISEVNGSGMKDCVSYAGKKHWEDKAEAFTNADIFVHPSYLDCLPLVLLEAMQNSLPVISTDHGAIPDAVEDGVTGFIVPQKDAEALAEKLEILIKDPDLRKRMGQAGREKYEREFTLEKFEKRMVEILEKIGNQ